MLGEKPAASSSRYCLISWEDWLEAVLGKSKSMGKKKKKSVVKKKRVRV